MRWGWTTRPNSSAVMYAAYNGVKQNLTGDDTSGIQAVWTARQPDSYAAGGGNKTFATASDLTSQLNGNAQATIASLDIVNGADTHYFIVTAPSNTSGTLTVTMQSSNLSALDPKVVLYNSSQKGLTQALGSGLLGSTVTTSVTGVTAGQKFYIKTQAAGGGITGGGAYGLLINFGTGTMNSIAPPNTVVLSQPDQGGGSSKERTPIHVGSLKSTGDSLSIDHDFQRAVEIVDAGWVDAGTFIDPAEVWVIDILAAIGHSAPNTADGRALRAQAIQAIDDVLDSWKN